MTTPTGEQDVGRRNGRTLPVRDGAAQVELSLDDLRAVALYAAASAESALPIFEEACPTDGRPRAAVEAARAFASGAARSNLQRSAAFAAHRAATEASGGPASHAAHAAGNAAAAAYLHPLARADQVGHILRAAAHAARAAELAAGDDPNVGRACIRTARSAAPPAVVAVLRRYPAAPDGRSRVARLMKDLDTALRNA